MWIFESLWRALKGNDGYKEQNAQVDTALVDEVNGKDITPKED